MLLLRWVSLSYLSHKHKHSFAHSRRCWFSDWPRCPQYDDSFVTGTGIDIQTMNNNGRATDRDRHMMDECSCTSLLVCMWVCCVVAKHHGREEVGVSSCSHFEKWTWMNSIWGIWMNEWKTGRCNEFKFPTAVDGSVLIRMFQDCLRKDILKHSEWKKKRNVLVLYNVLLYLICNNARRTTKFSSLFLHISPLSIIHNTSFKLSSI